MFKIVCQSGKSKSFVSPAYTSLDEAKEILIYFVQEIASEGEFYSIVKIY